MKKIITVVLATFILSSCMLAQPKKYTYPEMVQVNVYENSRWQQGKGGGDANQFITEATPKGQSVNNWKELITLQYYSKATDNYSITQHLKEKESLLTGACPDINFNLLSESGTEAVYQWSISNCKGQDDQFEVARYIKTDNGIHRVSYSQKNSSPTQKDYDKWLYIIKDARVIKI